MKPKDYLGLPYHWCFVRDPDGGGGKDWAWCATIAEFRGCITDGRTLKEATKRMRKVFLFWVELMLDDDQPIPEPFDDDEWYESVKKMREEPQ